MEEPISQLEDFVFVEGEIERILNSLEEENRKLNHIMHTALSLALITTPLCASRPI
jgi:hypothetical protein